MFCLTIHEYRIMYICRLKQKRPMNSTLKSILLWFFATIFTLVIAVYQRMTGPTYPVSGHVAIASQEINYKLIRTYAGADDAKVEIMVRDTSVRGEIQFRRFRSYDDWTLKPMIRKGDTLIGRVPHQDIAGKVMYNITLMQGAQKFPLTKDPVVIRYKGDVPAWVLIPHIFFIFMAMLFSTRTGLEVIFKGKSTVLYTWITIITLVLGGLILGPIVQKFSFNAYWTGWPFGHDLTDNKSLVAFIFWLVALFVLKKNRENKVWPIVASVILLIVFLIPHSMLGSEIDFTKTQQNKAVTK